MRSNEEVTLAKPAPEAVRRAEAALSRYPQCFWMRRLGTLVDDRNDVELVVRRLRENGGPAAWQAAREIEECL